MAVVIASSLRKEIAGNLLFEGVSFKVERGDRLSLSGPNGAGKTTLLRVLAGETEVHGGELVFAKGTRIALHDQRPPLQRGLSLREYALSGAADLAATERELRSLEQAMATGDYGPATLRRYAEAQARLEHAGGYTWRERAAAALRGLGFSEQDLERPLDTFSGGELTRASLARALAGDPDLLLLDEPTNHLDVENLEWLEQELQSLDAAVILVAHDRWFLEAVTTAVLELEAGRSLFFPGPWHAWRREKAARAAAAAKTAERVGEDIARLERFVERFRYKKTKARQAQAKLTQIQRLEQTRAGAAGELELHERGSVLDCAQRGTGLPRPQAQTLLGRFLFSGWEQHEKRVNTLSGGERRRLALALVVASGTSLRTTSISKAARRSRRRSTPFPARCCWSPTTGRCWTPSPTASSRSRTKACIRTTAAGPSTRAGG